MMTPEDLLLRMFKYMYIMLYCTQGISKCRDDELEHKEIGLKHDAELVRHNT